MTNKEEAPNYSGKGKYLTLSDEKYQVYINREFLGIAQLIRSDNLDTVCQLDIDQSDEKILRDAEAEYIMRNL